MTSRQFRNNAVNAVVMLGYGLVAAICAVAFIVSFAALLVMIGG